MNRKEVQPVSQEAKEAEETLSMLLFNGHELNSMNSIMCSSKQQRINGEHSTTRQANGAAVIVESDKLRVSLQLL